MTVHRINPDSTILGQLDGQWEKICSLLVWKLAKNGVTISFKDMEDFSRLAISGEAILFTHGHKDSIDFKIVNRAAAERLAAYDAKQRGIA